MPEKSIMLIAGEFSGDMHAAAIVRAIRRRAPDVNIFGIGGAALRQAGMEIVYDAREMAVLGLTEVLRKYFFFRRVFHAMLDLARQRRPAAVLLVDYPGFNLRFAAAAKAAGLKVIYYVCPQVWAWHRGRIPAMARDIDRLLTIFPFEPPLFEGSGLAADFVGHPLVAETAAALQAPAAALPWQSGAPRIALLPGSRRHEIQRLFPVMWQTALRLEQKHPQAAFIAAAPSAEAAQWIQTALAPLSRSGPGPKRFAITAGQTRQVLRQADAALVASGTATLETALLRCPMVVVYKVSAATYLAGRMLIRVPYLGMVNLLWRHLDPDPAHNPLCPEFIQQAARPDRLADALEPLLSPTPRRQAMLAGLNRVGAALGGGGGADRAAEIVLSEIGMADSARPAADF